MLLEAYDAWVWEEDRTLPRALLLEKVRDAVGLYTMWTDQVNQELLDHAPKLRAVSQMSVGVENIDLAACTARGVPVGYTPGAVSEATADQTMAILLALSRRIVDGVQYVKAGKWVDWSPVALMGNDVFGKTMGIVGLGNIGRCIARRARGFSMPLLYTGRSRKPDAEREFGAQYRSLDALLAESDIVVLILPLTPETTHLIDAAALARMKPSAILVNVARGPVVDSRALYEALAAGRLRGAALDVTDPEPINMDNPLLTLENCLIVPHTGTTTEETREVMTDVSVRNLINGIEGRPMLHCANPEAQRG
jgi:lactate dehydrogenase-like 2-hydroxyacid dehydrogenase